MGCWYWCWCCCRCCYYVLYNEAIKNRRREQMHKKHVVSMSLFSYLSLDIFLSRHLSLSTSFFLSLVSRHSRCQPCLRRHHATHGIARQLQICIFSLHPSLFKPLSQLGFKHEHWIPPFLSSPLLSFPILSLTCLSLEAILIPLLIRSAHSGCDLKENGLASCSHRRLATQSKYSGAHKAQ